MQISLRLKIQSLALLWSSCENFRPLAEAKCQTVWKTIVSFSYMDQCDQKNLWVMGGGAAAIASKSIIDLYFFPESFELISLQVRVSWSACYVSVDNIYLYFVFIVYSEQRHELISLTCILDKYIYSHLVQLKWRCFCINFYTYATFSLLVF